MNQTVLPQLQTIEADLTSQESQLAAQLASVREKLAGIRAVMPMFLETADTAGMLAATEEVSSANEPIVEDVATSSDFSEEVPILEKSAVSEASEPTETKVTESKKAAQKNTSTKKKATEKKAPAKKADGRAASWQKYTRPGVKNESIPDAVKLILETQPESDFKIADVMTALFKEDMPRSQYLKARNRISNVLSGGVRAGDWHKGERSTYRITAAPG